MKHTLTLFTALLLAPLAGLHAADAIQPSQPARPPKLLPPDWDPALAGDEVLARLINTGAPQVKGAHDAEMLLAGDRAYIVAEVNDLRPGEGAGWPEIYSAMSVVNLKTLAVEKIISVAKGGQAFENVTLSAGSCFVPRILRKDASTLRCYFAVEHPGKGESQTWFRDFDLTTETFAKQLHRAKLKTAAGVFDMQPRHFHADARAQGFNKPAKDYGLYLFDSFKRFGGRIYVAINNYPAGQNALARVHDDLATFEVIGHYNEPQKLQLSESAVNRLPDGTWMAICRQDGGNGNYTFATSKDGKAWTPGEHRSFVPNGTNSKPTFDRIGGLYYLGWQEATRIHGVARSVFNIDISRDGAAWERKYRFETPKSFQYPTFREHSGSVWLCVTQGDTDPSRKERIMFGKLEDVGQLASQAGKKRLGAEAGLHQPTPPFPLWNASSPVPRAKDIPVLEGVEFRVIKPYEVDKDGYRFLHGVALAWHNGRLYASFGHNKGGENTDTEEARFSTSNDGGKTWSAVATIDAGTEPGVGVSHGVFLSLKGRLWAFHGAYTGTMQKVHTRAYLLDEAKGTWQHKGTVIEGGFWPLGEPQKMTDGNWIMPGISVGKGNPAAVAVSHGDDLMKWNLVVIPRPDVLGNMWGESSILVEGRRITNIARYGQKAVALVAVSDDLGRTWTPSRPSNLPMATSKPCAGVLRNGQRYLICSTSADGGKRRSPLTIAVGKPGEPRFSRVFVIRHTEFPGGPGESHPKAALSYPCALEHNGKLYVGYSNNGGNVGRKGAGRQLWNNNSAELAIIPIPSLRVTP